MATTIVLVRHGETDWNRDNRFQGRADPPLNEAGREQARRLASELESESLTALYTSPLRRAYETAEIVAELLELEVNVADALVEVDVGSWSGLTRAEVEARFPDRFRRWLEWDSGWDDGETYEALAERVLLGLRDISATHRGARVAAVTHGGPIRAMLGLARGFAPGANRTALPPIGNCFLARLAIQDGTIEQVD